MKPEDILADGIDATIINGISVRKGTIGAFLANIEILEDSNTSESSKQEAVDQIKMLAPAVIAIGLLKHVTFKNADVMKILMRSC